MKVNYQRDISFKSIYTSKAVKKGLEFAADNGALFGAASAVAFSTARPLAIMLAPKTDRENRKIAATKSITSSIIGFILMLALSLPLSKSIKKIDKNPEKYLNQETIKALKDNSTDLENSKGYVFATQLFKLGLGTIAAIPKAILVAAGMPYLLNAFNNSGKEKNNSISKESKNNPSFKANSGETLTNTIGKVLNRKELQNFATKYKDSNFPMHITALTDITATLAFIQQTKKRGEIKENRQNALIYNSAISTGLSVVCGYLADKLLDKPTQKFIDNFRIKNAGEKGLEKQIQGIKIAKPILILGTIYYLMIPFISTFLAERADKSFDNG